MEDGEEIANERQSNANSLSKTPTTIPSEEITLQGAGLNCFGNRLRAIRVNKKTK